jgi:hypothetical protein
MGTHYRCADARSELGVYLLGAIEPLHRAKLDLHLGACQPCREELAALAGLPALLHRVPDAQVILESDPALRQEPAVPPEVLVNRAAGLRRRNRALAAAAVAALIAGTAAVSTAIQGQPQRQVSAPPAWEATVHATSSATHASAAVRYAPRAWGIDIEARITSVPSGTRCQLWVTDSGGQRLPAGSWTIAAGHSASWYPASASLPVAALRSFEITTGAGRTLVTITARPTAGSTVRR